MYISSLLAPSTIVPPLSPFHRLNSPFIRSSLFCIQFVLNKETPVFLSGNTKPIYSPSSMNNFIVMLPISIENPILIARINLNQIDFLNVPIWQIRDHRNRTSITLLYFIVVFTGLGTYWKIHAHYTDTCFNWSKACIRYLHTTTVIQSSDISMCSSCSKILHKKKEESTNLLQSNRYWY